MTTLLFELNNFKPISNIKSAGVQIYELGTTLYFQKLHDINDFNTLGTSGKVVENVVNHPWNSIKQATN